MSLIQLPPGMTPEQYWESPEGRREAEAQRLFQEETLAKRRRQAAQPAAPNLPTTFGARLPAPQRLPPARPGEGGQLPDPGFYGNPLPPVWDMGQPQPRPTPIKAPGQAQPAQDPYASSTKTKGVNDIAREIEAALAEMVPDMGDAERRLMAADLAREYRQRRDEVVRGMTRPAQEKRDLGRESKWDGNKYEYTDTPEYQAKLAARQESQRMQEASQAQRREQHQARMAQLTRQMAEDASRQRVGGRAPESAADSPERRQAAKRFNDYVRGPSPGMAQAIPQQSEGTPYGGPSQQDMYWRLVDGGMDPVQASQQVRRAFAHAPR